MSEPTKPTMRASTILRPVLGAGLVMLAGLAGTCAAHAGATLPIGTSGASITIGLGLRADYTDESEAAPDGKSDSSSFTLDSVRLYVSGELTPSIKATFNTERDGNGHIDVLDGYAQYEPIDQLNIWLGRMLPPSDRANLDGPYYLNTWLYPGVVSQYPAKFAGRDEGATVWGKVFEKKLVYSVGVFEGHNRITGASNQGDHLLYAARVAYNFLDPEPDPGYYTSSTYYGAVDVLTLALAGQYEKDGVGTALDPGNYKSWNADLLFEKNLHAAGVVTLEGAFYKYDTGGVADVSPTFNGAGSTDNVGGLSQGTAYLVGAAYLIPTKVFFGQFQPALRFQRYHDELNNSVTKQYDADLNYIIKGHNARVSLDYTRDDISNAPNTNRVILGVQLQF